MLLHLNTLVESDHDSRLDALALSDEDRHVWVLFLDFRVCFENKVLEGRCCLREQKSDFLDGWGDSDHCSCGCLVSSGLKLAAMAPVLVLALVLTPSVLLVSQHVSAKDCKPIGEGKKGGATRRAGGAEKSPLRRSAQT